MWTGSWAVEQYTDQGIIQILSTEENLLSETTELDVNRKLGSRAIYWPGDYSNTIPQGKPAVRENSDVCDRAGSSAAKQ